MSTADKRRIDRMYADLSRLRAKHGRDRTAARAMPDLSVERTYPSQGDGFAPLVTLRTGGQHPDAKSFPVGNSHKQGLELITPGTIASGHLKYMGGKKPNGF